MSLTPTIRPLGDADLAALRSRFVQGFEVWAHQWLAATQLQVRSVQPCTRAMLESQVTKLMSGAGLVLAMTNRAVAWSPRADLAQFGRNCVLQGDKLLGDTRLNDVFSELGRSALEQLLVSLADCDSYK